MNLSSVLGSLSPALRPPSSDRVRLVIGYMPPEIHWQMQRGDEVIIRDQAKTLAEIRSMQIRAGIWDVVIDGPDTPSLRLAAREYGWALAPDLASRPVLFC